MWPIRCRSRRRQTKPHFQFAKRCPTNSSLSPRFDKLKEALIKLIISLICLSPRSGRQRKAWGGAKRNPRLATIMKFKRAKRAIAQTPQVTVMNRLSPTSRAAILYSTDPGVPLAKPRSTPGFTLSPRSAGCNLLFHGSWGSARKASLHPRLYAVAALRGLQSSFPRILGFRSQSLAPPQALRYRRASRAAIFYSTDPGVPLAKPRSTPGFTLSPRSAG